MPEDCMCMGSGYCARHKMQKNDYLFKLCRTDARYRELWEAKADGRDPCDGCTGQPPPPAAERARNFLGFLKDFVWQPGLVSREEAEETAKICEACAFRSGDKCAMCGCYIPAAVYPKAKHCPLGKWRRDAQDFLPYVPNSWRAATLVVIPACGKHELTRQCVADCARELVRVLVVDNQGDYQPLGNEAVERPAGNLGWGASSNLGLGHALSQPVERVVLLNNDVRLSHHFFCGLIAAEKVSGAKIVHAVMNGGPESHLAPDGYAGPANEYQPRPVHRPVGCVDGTAVLIAREVLQKCGELDLSVSPRYGWNLLADLSIRAKLEGFKAAVTEAAYCHHAGAATASELHGSREAYEQGAKEEAAAGMLRKWGDDYRSLMNATGLRMGGAAAPESPGAMPPKPWPAISRKNLLFYILPLKHPERVWQWHVEQLRRFLPLFNGRKIITIATPAAGDELALDDAAAVRAEFGEDAAQIEFIERPNDRERWEAPAMLDMLGRVRSTAADEATFYFHAKGVRRPDQTAVRPWSEFIYLELLENAGAATDALTTAKACGVLMRLGDPTGAVRGAGEWHFSGNGFWVRHDALFGSANWQEIQDHTHGAEAYLGKVFRREEVHCLKDSPGDVYNPRTWALSTPNKTGRVSIIVTARNYGRFLRDCLESCFWQDRAADEVIYCDDASQDDSLAVAAQFYPQGLKVTALPDNLGVADARNVGAGAATGDLLLFVDADNILPKNYLSRMLDSLDYRTPFVYPDMAFFGELTGYYRQPEWQDADLWTGNHCDTCCLMRREAFDLAGRWVAGPWAHMEDYHLFLRMSCFGAARRANVALGYRKHGASLTEKSMRDHDPAAMRAAVERIHADVRRWAVEKFGRVPSRGERDLGVTAAAPRELASF